MTRQIRVLRRAQVDLLEIRDYITRDNPAAHPSRSVDRLLEHGGPKAARVFPGGHMGQTPETLPTIIRWLRKELEG